MKKAFGIMALTGILMTASISYAAFVITSPASTVVHASPQEIKIESRTAAANLLLESLSATGPSYYTDKDGEEPLTEGNAIGIDGSPMTHMDDFVIRFKASTSHLGTVFSSDPAYAKYLGTLNFTFHFPDSSSIDVETLAASANFYYEYRLTGQTEYSTFELTPWYIGKSGTVEGSGTYVSPISTNKSEKTLTISILLTDFDLTNPTAGGVYDILSLADLLFRYSARDTYDLVCDFDFSSQTGLAVQDLRDTYIEAEVKP